MPSFTSTFAVFLIIISVAFCLRYRVPTTPSYSYQTKYFKQRVDHFGYANNDQFDQRYLIADQYWNKETGPIFFYAGNEGDVTVFAENTGIMWEWAPEFEALIIFAEHRYYGTTMPYGNQSYAKLDYLGYLTVEQALADFAVFLTDLKKTLPGAANKPVVTFGGSYGGMLASWFRMKYPHVTIGALAASAPVLQFTDVTPCNAFFGVVTRDFESESPDCSQSIRNSWAALRRLGATADGRQWLTSEFHLCNPMQETDVDAFSDFLREVWGNFAMTDYPYPTTFLMPLPAHPISVACQNLKNPNANDKELLLQIYLAVSVFQNYTGETPCNDLLNPDGSIGGSNGWPFQTCTEMVMPMCTDNVNDMFEKSDWNLTLYAKQCQKVWGVTPEEYKAITFLSNFNLTSVSNIIFSNGLRDPWSAGGVHFSPSDSVIILPIEGAAHHLDLRSSNAGDPKSVTVARMMEKLTIKKWITEAYNSA